MSKKRESIVDDDQRSQCDFDPFDERPRRSRLAREARIGLGVIFILLVVLGVVLYQQMTGADRGATASAEDGSPAPEADVTPASSAPESASSAPKWNEQRVMEAKAGSSDVAQKEPAAKVDSWYVTVEDGQAHQGNANAAAESASPSFMPKLVAPTPTSRYSDRSSTPTADQTARHWQSGGVSAAGSAEDRERYNSFRAPYAQAAAGGAEIEVSEAAGSAGPHVDATQSASTPLSNDAHKGSESLRDNAQQAQTPMYAASQGPWYKTYADLSDATRQVDVSAQAPVQADVSEERPSEVTLAPNNSSRQLASDANPMRSNPGLKSVSSRTLPQPARVRHYTAGDSSGKAGTYLVQPNDSYWVISERLYGTGAYFRALAQHNRATIPDENRLRVGQQILAPDASELEKAYPDLCPKLAHRKARERRTSLASTRNLPKGGRVYVVQQGDNLFDIARYELGKAARWTEIVDLNQQLLGSDLNELNYLTPGMKLILPDDQEEPAANVARQPSSVYQR